MVVVVVVVRTEVGVVVVMAMMMVGSVRTKSPPVSQWRRRFVTRQLRDSRHSHLVLLI